MMNQMPDGSVFQSCAAGMSNASFMRRVCKLNGFHWTDRIHPSFHPITLRLGKLGIPISFPHSDSQAKPIISHPSHCLGIHRTNLKWTVTNQTRCGHSAIRITSRQTISAAQRSAAANELTGAMDQPPESLSQLPRRRLTVAKCVKGVTLVSYVLRTVSHVRVNCCVSCRTRWHHRAQCGMRFRPTSKRRWIGSKDSEKIPTQQKS
jgi:hypothetical protein